MDLIHKLQIIVLLDSICFGLTYPFLSTYKQSLGATHVTVGILSVGYLLCSLISNEIINLFNTCGRWFSIVMVLHISMLSHLSLILTKNYWVIIFGRCVFGLVANQSLNLCSCLLLQRYKKTDKGSLTVLSVLNGSGYILGPIIAGYLFSIGFFLVALLAVFLTFIAICIAMSILEDDDVSEINSDEISIIEKVYENLNNSFDDFLKSDYKRNWDIIAIKVLHVSSVMIFYGKFTQLLKHNYNSSPISMGYTYAYMNGLVFASTYFTLTVKGRYVSFSPIVLVDITLKFLSTCLFVACYSPLYTLYLIMCIPVIFLNTFIDSVWRDLFATRKNESLERLNGSLKIVAGMTTPLVFGVLCNIIGYNAVIIFSVIPVIISVYIMNRFTRRYDLFVTTDEKNE